MFSCTPLTTASLKSKYNSQYYRAYMLLNPSFLKKINGKQKGQLHLFYVSTIIALEMYLVVELVQAFEQLLSWWVAPRFALEHIALRRRTPAWLHLVECFPTVGLRFSPLVLCTSWFASLSIEQCLLLPQNYQLAFSPLRVLAVPPRSCRHHSSHQLLMCMRTLTKKAEDKNMEKMVFIAKLLNIYLERKKEKMLSLLIMQWCILKKGKGSSL